VDYRVYENIRIKHRSFLSSAALSQLPRSFAQLLLWKKSRTGSSPTMMDRCPNVAIATVEAALFNF
jgi:hypothetical protein